MKTGVNFRTGKKNYKINLLAFSQLRGIAKILKLRKATRNIYLKLCFSNLQDSNHHFIRKIKGLAVVALGKKV